MKSFDKLIFAPVRFDEESLVQEFLLEDIDIHISDFNIVKLLEIPFDGPNWKAELKAFHTYFTERAPDNYYGIGYSIVKNYSSSKQYSVTDEKDLSEPMQKLLKFLLQDGTFIFLKRNDIEQCEKILISVNGTSPDSLAQHTKVVEKTLLDFIQTFKY